MRDHYLFIQYNLIVNQQYASVEIEENSLGNFGAFICAKVLRK